MASGSVTSTQTTNMWFDSTGDQVALEDPDNNITITDFNALGQETQSSIGEIISGTGSWTINHLTPTPGQSRTFEIYVHLATAPTGGWRSDYSVTGYTLTDATSTATPLDGEWYDLGSITIGTTDNAPALTVSYSGESGPDEVCITGYSDFDYYNSYGQLDETLDRDGRATTFTYDTIGRETSENFFTSPTTTGTPEETISWSYDSAGELASATDTNITNSTTSENDYAYDLLGEVISNTQTIPGLTPTVGFNSTYTDGNRTQLASMIGTEGSANYDFVNSYAYAGVLGQMSEVSQQSYSGTAPDGDSVDSVAAKSATFEYDLQNEFTTVNRYADASTTNLVASGAYGYDAEGDITSLAYTKSGSTLPSYAWTYDSLGDMSSATETLGSIVNSVDYTSDSTGQILSATGGPSDESFSYDANGNNANSGVVIGMDNEILYDGTYHYAYDAQGNQTARWVQSSANSTAGLLIPASGDTDITYYTWDNLNRMVGVTHYANFGGTADLQISYIYDAFNRMVSVKNTTGDTTTQTRFAYDGNQIVMQFSGTGTSALTASNLTDRYLWGPAVDQLMADEQVSSLTSAGTVLFALTDNQNTVRDLATYDSGTDATTVVDHRVFSTYGKMVSQTNPATLEPAAVDCIFGYTGKYADAATGLQWNLNRWYNPSLQTWMSQDPDGLCGRRCEFVSVL